MKAYTATPHCNGTQFTLKRTLVETLMIVNLIHLKAINLIWNKKRAKCSEINETLMRQLMGINGETFFLGAHLRKTRSAPRKN